MKEVMKKFAHNLHPLEFEAMSSVTFGDLLEEGYKQSVYASKNAELISANRDGILDARGVETAVIAVLKADGNYVDKENGTVYVMNLRRIQDRLANRVWLMNHVVPRVRSDIDTAAEAMIREAKEKKEADPKDTISVADSIKLPCRTCKKMDDRRDAGGKVWCKLWDTPVENVIQLKSQEKYDGHCAPTKHFTQGQPDGGTNQWGNETPTYMGTREKKASKKLVVHEEK